MINTPVQPAYDRLRQRAEAAWKALEQATMPRVLVQWAGCSAALGIAKIYAALERELSRQGVAASVERVGCNGMCYLEPQVEVQLPGGPRVVYPQVTLERVPELVQTVVKAARHRPDWAFAARGPRALEGIARLDEHPFMAL
ncbi:MAG TPA: hypothetical protein VGL23_10245 [Chloroflexota bacterium]